MMRALVDGVWCGSECVCVRERETQKQMPERAAAARCVVVAWSCHWQSRWAREACIWKLRCLRGTTRLLLPAAASSVVVARTCILLRSPEYSYAAVHRDNEWITITITQARLSPSVSPSRPLSAVGVVVPTTTVSSHRSGHIVFRQT